MMKMSKQRRSRKPVRQPSRWDWCREATGGVSRNVGGQQSQEKAGFPELVPCSMTQLCKGGNSLCSELRAAVFFRGHFLKSKKKWCSNNILRIWKRDTWNNVQIKLWSRFDLLLTRMGRLDHLYLILTQNTDLKQWKKATLFITAW